MTTESWKLALEFFLLKPIIHFQIHICLYHSIILSSQKIVFDCCDYYYYHYHHYYYHYYHYHYHYYIYILMETRPGANSCPLQKMPVPSHYSLQHFFWLTNTLNTPDPNNHNCICTNKLHTVRSSGVSTSTMSHKSV